jgi:hypothetical protein
MLLFMATPAGFEPATCPLGGGIPANKIKKFGQKSIFYMAMFLVCAEKINQYRFVEPKSIP